MYALSCSLKGRPSAQVWDLVSGLLYQFHSQGIEEGEEPAPAGAAALTAANEFELALEPGILAPPEKFSAYFENLRDAERARRAIEPVLAALHASYDIHETEEADYAELWKEHFQPIDVLPNWFVRAGWHEAAPRGKLELVIEPGMAFGTGSHETTRACLELIANACKAHRCGADTRVMDFGCGSGILSIALKKMGSGTVYAVDIDPLAIEATHRNSARNGVEVLTSLESSIAHAITDPLDGIVANILKNTLLEYAGAFHSWLKPGAFLILSGLLEEQERDVLSRYEMLGFQRIKRLSQNSWVSLLLRR